MWRSVGEQWFSNYAISVLDKRFGKMRLWLIKIRLKYMFSYYFHIILFEVMNNSLTEKKKKKRFNGNNSIFGIWRKM